MQRPWMPLYIADYLADTLHLTTQEHGAYLLLIMSYWKDGKLPAEDAKLARLVRLSLPEWIEIRQTIADLFQDGWRHTRIDAEIAKVAGISEKRKAAAARSRIGRGQGADPALAAANAPALAGANGEQADQQTGQQNGTHFTLHTSHSTGRDSRTPTDSEAEKGLGAGAPVSGLDPQASLDDEKAAAVAAGLSLEQWRAMIARQATAPTEAGTTPQVAGDQPENPKTAAARLPKPESEYFIVEGRFRITNKDLAKLKRTYSHVNVEARILEASTFAIEKWGDGWWSALLTWLGKEDRKGRSEDADRRARAEVEVEKSGRAPASRFTMRKTTAPA